MLLGGAHILEMGDERGMQFGGLGAMFIQQVVLLAWIIREVMQGARSMASTMVQDPLSIGYRHEGLR